MNFTDRLNELISAGLLTCWHCKEALELENVKGIDLDSEKIIYHCGCGNGGYRTFAGMVEHARRHQVAIPSTIESVNVVPTRETHPSVIFADCRVDDADRRDDFKIVHGRSVLNYRVVQCAGCHRNVRSDNVIISNADDLTYCPDCFNTRFFACSSCGETTPRSQGTQTIHHGMVCSTCVEDFDYCEQCGFLELTEDIDDDGLCTRCHANAEADRRQRQSREDYVRSVNDGHRHIANINFRNDPELDRIARDPTSEV